MAVIVLFHRFVVLVRVLLYSVMATTVHCHPFIALDPLTPVGPVGSPFVLPVIAFGIFTVPNWSMACPVALG
jgi:hypothetical protein